MKNKIFICDCHAIDHQLVISNIDNDEDIYFQFHIDDAISFIDKLKNFLPFIFKWQKKIDDNQYIIFSKETELEIKNHLKIISEN